MNAITPFTFDTNPIRVVDRDGAPMFVAADVCAALAIDPTAIRKLDADERGLCSMQTPGGEQSIAALTEAGVYTLALRCRDAMTPGTPPYRFRKWVTGEVLPALRKTGSYGTGGAVAALNDPAALRGLLLGYSERVLALEERNTALAGENATLAPKADALDRIAATEGSMSITAAAKVLNIGPRALGTWMRDHGWTYRRPDGDRVLAYQAKIDAGYLEHRLVTFQPPGLPERSAFQVMVTAKGIAKLGEALSDERKVA